MPEKAPVHVSAGMKEQIDFIIIVRRIKLLGIIITTGIILIFFTGLLIPASPADPADEFNMLGLITLIIALVLCPLSVIMKNVKTKKITSLRQSQSFIAAYFNAHILAFAICDFAALICITTSLFISKNIIFASAGLTAGLVCMYFNFPKESELI